MRLSACGLLLGLLVAIPAVASTGEDLHRLVEDYYDAWLPLNPFMATFNGDHRYDDQFVIDIAPAHRERSLQLERDYLEKILALSPDTLSASDRVTWEVFRRGREEAIEGLAFPDHLLPVNQFFSMPQALAMLGAGDSVQPLETLADHENWLKRLERWPEWVDQAIANMREGIATGVVQPRLVIEKTLPQLQAYVVDDPTASPFHRPAAHLPDTFSQADRERLIERYRGMIEIVVTPAYSKLHDFLRDEYLPHCRESISLQDLPGGKEWYAYLVRVSTTTDMTPEEIHALGRSEVDRIRGEMERLRAAMASAETRDAPPRGYDSEQDMLDAYEQLRERVTAAIPRLFEDVPATEFEIRPVDPVMQKTSAGAFYMAGAPDGSRPGVFYVNTGNWQERNRQSTEALYLHEAVPGHHFQISLQRELGELPRFRRFGVYSAFAEGWGLYAETIGHELGLYEDPFYELGALGSESFRARRLVVDTGIHALGWTREEALEWIGNEAEVDRYIVMPAQALAYKVGQLQIRRIRDEAEKRLGDAFDVRAFHSMVLRNGAVPLDVLELEVARWLDAQPQ